MNENRGDLPKYAQKSAKSRLVKILCKHGCREERWAEMNVDYPGEGVIEVAEFGDYEATCLKCGVVAKDPYNWFR